MNHYFPRHAIGQELHGIFAEPHPVELEVGTGKGLFIAAAAESHRTVFFVGLELASKYAVSAQARIERLGLSNARVFACDAAAVLCDEVPSNRVQAVHVYFPDPWWKKRHKKRRVLNERLLLNTQRILTTGGQLHFWTDVLDYYEATIDLIEQVTTLKGPYFVDEPTASHDMDYRTHFERRTRLNGLPVYRARYEKDSSLTGGVM